MENCPSCGEFLDLEVVNTEFFDNIYEDTLIGKCSHCGKRYKWHESYVFKEYYGVEEIPAEE